MSQNKITMSEWVTLLESASASVETPPAGSICRADVERQLRIGARAARERLNKLENAGKIKRVMVKREHGRVPYYLPV